jgi:spore coat polysaccharide biosynthesis protein SpsF
LSTTTPPFSTEQEAFWAGAFGSEYIERNTGAQLLASNLHFFSTALRAAGSLTSAIEFGANVGMNLRALQLLYPAIQLRGIEINPEAARQLGNVIGSDRVHDVSIYGYEVKETFDLVLIKGVLIHLEPTMLPLAYDKLVAATGRWLLVAEYYNPSPVAIPYRGHVNRLFKRDFAGEILERHSSLRLADYGFAYRRDPAFPLDDITWFLLEKKG